jgi:hypothetical protein
LIIDVSFADNTGTPTGTVKCSVSSTTAGLPDEVTIYGELTFTPVSGRTNTLVIPMSPSLSDATTYGVFFKGETATIDSSNRYTVNSITPSSYASGSFVSDTGGGWSANTSFDTHMQIWQGTSKVGPLTETKTVTVADPCNDKYTLLWRNSLGGFSQWTFTNAQEVTFNEEDRQKFKDFLTEATGVTINQLEALDEIQRPGDIVKEGFNLLASQTRTHKKIGQAIYQLSTSGGKTGVIILNQPSVYKTDATTADFQILVRGPEIL